MNDNQTMETVEVVDEVTQEVVKSSKGKIIGKTVITVGFIAGVGVLIARRRKRKNKGSKVEEMMIKKLEKKGYTVMSPIEDLEVCEDLDSENN